MLCIPDRLRAARCAWLLACVVALVAPLRAGVIVLDAAGAGDYTQFLPAFAAAADGDVLLVKPGQYYGLQVFPPLAKAITIVGDPGGSRPAIADLVMQALPAGRTLVLRGLDLEAAVFRGLDVFDCAGAVVIEDCVIKGAVGWGESPVSPAGWSGARLQDCASVSFVRCNFVGGRGTDESLDGPLPFGPGDGGAAAEIRASHVAFHDCTLTGGAGGQGSFNTGANGGAGLLLIASSALISGCLAQGGAGGTDCSAAQLPAWCNGGPGVELVSGSTLQVLEGSWTGGVAGAGAGGQPGLPGVPFVGPVGQPTVFVGTARSIDITSPVREQQTGTLQLDGLPGDVVLLFMAFGGASVPLPGKQGWLALAPPMLGPVVFGPIVDPSGVQALGFTAPDVLPAALEGVTVLLQGAFVDGSEVTIGGMTSFTLVDSAF
jgi:hypothetical protein